MVISFGVRQKKVQAFSKELEKMGLVYEFVGTNEVKIFLSEDKKHCIDVDFFKHDEFYKLTGRHNMTKEEIHNLHRILLMINEHFSDIEISEETQ